MRKTVVLVVLVSLLIPAAAFAGPKGKGQGQSQGRPSSAESAMEKVGKETVEVVADELLKESSPSGETGMPPGLSKKDKMPPGLEKQGKTPAGWEKGQKEGWSDSPGAIKTKRESALRRMIRGAFRKSQQQPAQQ